ncbi:MAG: hypothetical protein LC789_05210 [Actinobacteria bacterium]|nr:hypothetical protein [Actinomycetota bacterium]MCA1720047.1 hypothetical protein [Actinomycetota bacterium]
MALQPVGPLPASTYWRRRVLIGLVVLVLLLVGLKACGGSDAQPRALATSAKASASTRPSPAASTAASPSPAGSPSPVQVAACGDAALQVTVEADATSYKPGAAPRFALSVVNTGAVPCRRALGPDAVEIRVFSGEDRIWSSDDCSKGTGQGVLELAPKDPRQMVVQWPGKRTKPGCDTGETAKPGTYRVSARVGDIVRQGSVFYVVD